jgi:hypothetical protein
MKTWICAVYLTLNLLYIPLQVFANSPRDSFLSEFIVNESLKIQQTSPNDYNALTNLYASRGENYLILGEDQKALEDFLLSYEYALICEEEENDLSFRPLFGTFLAHIRLEDLESAQKIYAQLNSIIKNSCYEYREPSSQLSRRNSNRIASQTLCLPCQSDWPILGPNHVPIRDCIERVENTAKALVLLIAAVKRPEVCALAIALVYELQSAAIGCCRAGGIWKGCLQKLVNKLHFWKESGVPNNPT